MTRAKLPAALALAGFVALEVVCFVLLATTMSGVALAGLVAVEVICLAVVAAVML